MAVAVTFVLCACGPTEREVETPTAPRATLDRGRHLLQQYQCGSCHVIPEVPAARATVSSSLEGYGRRSYIAGRVANRPALLAAWIVDPVAVSPGATMPRMGVKPDEADAMAAYLLSLQ